MLLVSPRQTSASNCLTPAHLLTGGVSLALLAGIDAAWSGDWSRIGAISKDTELFLQSAMTVFGAWHLFMGMCAYIIADQNSQPALAVTAKVIKTFAAQTLHLDAVLRPTLPGKTSCLWQVLLHGQAASATTLMFVCTCDGQCGCCHRPWLWGLSQSWS